MARVFYDGTETEVNPEILVLIKRNATELVEAVQVLLERV